MGTRRVLDHSALPFWSRLYSTIAGIQNDVRLFWSSSTHIHSLDLFSPCFLFLFCLYMMLKKTSAASRHRSVCDLPLELHLRVASYLNFQTCGILVSALAHAKRSPSNLSITSIISTLLVNAPTRSIILFTQQWHLYVDMDMIKTMISIIQ